MYYEWREIKTWPSTEDGVYQRFEKGDFKCWVSKWATVGEGARVGARAKVGERATVGEGATVGARARVGEGARVGEWARVNVCLTCGPLGSRQAYLHHFPELGIFTTGCFYGTEKELLDKVRATHKNGPHAKAYKAAVAGLKALGKAALTQREKP